MVMEYIPTREYLGLLSNLTSINVPGFNTSKLFDYIETIFQSDLENKYSAPMLTIGIYIAAASICCICQMGLDIVHGFRSNKLWFPCKHFTINALSLTMIGVAMKLPLDLSGSMPSAVDQKAKLGSMAFMCTMMANLLPSLAAMDSNALFANIMALGVLVITLVVNICIQISTGVIVKKGKGIIDALEPLSSRGDGPKELLAVLAKILNSLSSPEELRVYGSLLYTELATIYVILLLLLLIIHVSSSLAILKSKQIIQHKYQKGHVSASEDVQQSNTGSFLTVATLQEHLRNYWIMARSGSPQFMLVCSATTVTAGVICLATFCLHIFTISRIRLGGYDSDYKWSTGVIFIVQSIGVILGSVAPVWRLLASICFKVSGPNFRTLFKLVFKVEKHWTQKLNDWKYGYVSLPFRSHKLQEVIKNLKILILNLCILLQCGIVVVSKIVELFYIKLNRSDGTGIETEEELAEDSRVILRKYVLQLETEEELADITLVVLLKSLDQLIQKSEKKQPKNLKRLIIEKSTDGFQGVRKYDNNDHHVQSSPSRSEEYHDCWSLSVVTLTTIAVTLPNIEKVEVESLLKSVREGLEYITLVEETLNATDDEYESIQKAAKLLWEEVDFHHKWLGFKLTNIKSQGDTTLQIVQSFLEKANDNINERRESLDDESKYTSICASSMSRISQTIINDQEIHNRLFDELSSRIADIMAACLTNLPRVIAMKCHTSVIEQREANVEAAAKLLGETKEIINTLQGPLEDKWRAYSSMTTDDLPFINKWRAHLN